MEQTIPQDLKYGIIYLYSDRRFSSGLHDAEAIVNKFVHPMQVEWIDDPGREGLLLIARRFNVGNIGRYATVRLTLDRMNRSGGWFEAIRRFADELMGVTDTGDGDIVIDESDFGYHYPENSSVFGAAPEAAPQDHTRVEPSRVARQWKKFTKRLRDVVAEDAMCNTSLPSVTTTNKSEKPSKDLLQAEEDLELKRLEKERKQALECIRRDIVNYIAHYHDDPKELMAELLRGKIVVGHPGRILVNGDMNMLKTLADNDVKVMSLTWNDPNCFGQCHSEIESLMKKPLTDFGREAIPVMNDLGIVIDVSHLRSEDVV
jgi:hypothetical protein